MVLRWWIGFFIKLCLSSLLKYICKMVSKIINIQHSNYLMFLTIYLYTI